MLQKKCVKNIWKYLVNAVLIDAINNSAKNRQQKINYFFSCNEMFVGS